MFERNAPMDKESMIIRSSITGLEYDDKRCVHIWNGAQAAKYLGSGATLLDLFPGYAPKDNVYKICYVFSREDHDMLYPLWCSHKL